MHDLRVDGARGALHGRHQRSSTTALQLLTRAGVRSLTSRPPTLEELFLRHYGDELDPAVR